MIKKHKGKKLVVILKILGVPRGWGEPGEARGDQNVEKNIGFGPDVIRFITCVRNNCFYQLNKF